jgi:uncharacterized phage infection (PIP) family protein YhgE
MEKRKSRIGPILAISVCMVVLLVCIVGTAGVWIVGRAASSAAVDLLAAVDTAAQSLRDGIFRVDAGIASLEETISTVETAAAQISQNVNDKGLVLTLLPETKEQELTDAVESLRATFASVRDYLKVIKETVQAVNSLPFVNLPVDALGSVNKLDEQMGKMITLVDELKTGISDFRANVAANISKITEVAANLKKRLGDFRTNMAQADQELSTIQNKSRQLQQMVPVIFVTSAVIVTLLALWIAYSQIVMIRRATTQLRSIGSLKAINEPAEPEVLIADESKSTSNEVGETGDPIQTEGDDNSPGEDDSPGNA